MEDQEKRILAIEFQLGIKQDIWPILDMRFRWKTGDDSNQWETILGTWRYDRIGHITGPAWWIIQKGTRDPHLISEKLLLNTLRNIKIEIEGKPHEHEA